MGCVTLVIKCMEALRQNYIDDGEERQRLSNIRTLTQQLLVLVGTKLQFQATLHNEAGGTTFFRHLYYLA